MYLPITTVKSIRECVLVWDMEKKRNLNATVIAMLLYLSLRTINLIFFPNSSLTILESN